MACVGCAERRKKLRDALLHGRMAEAMDVTVDGLRAIIGIDAGADHRKEAPVLTPALPTLSGKNKAELLEIAGNEGVVTEDGATNDQIIEAIETKRRKAA